MIASSRSNLVIGYHGCDKQVAYQLLHNPYLVKKSKKPYDWLGHGFYVWENKYERAFQWAKNKKKSGKIDIPFVLGVILTLGNCLDLLDSLYINYLSSFHSFYEDDTLLAGETLPENKDVIGDEHKDTVVRELDCSLIEYMHTRMAKDGLLGYDTVRGVFQEGGPAFPGAGIKKKSHIQICIRNMDSVKGFFYPKTK